MSETVTIEFDDNRAEAYRQLEEIYGEDQMKRLCMAALDMALIEAADLKNHEWDT